MRPPGQQRDAGATQPTHHQRAGVAGNTRGREPRQVAVGDADRVLDLACQRAKARAEHDGETGGLGPGAVADDAGGVGQA